MKLLCSKIEARKTFCGIYKAVLSLKKCKGGRSPQEKVSLGSVVLCVCVCVCGLQAPLIKMHQQHHESTKTCCALKCRAAPSKASHLVFEIHEQTSRQELRDIFFHALEISTYKYLKVCIL